MKKGILLIPCILFLAYTNLEAQQYTAEGYFNMENDPGYTMMKQRQESGDTLSAEEQKFLTEYKSRLNAYFDKLPDEEKSNYYKYRSTWSVKPGSEPVSNMRQDQDVYSGEKSAYTQYLVSSGIFGFIYGLTAAAIIQPAEGSVTAGLALLSAGTSVLIPVLANKDKVVTYNSLKLSIHGKVMGYAHGAALGLLIQGDNIDEGKLLLALAGISSIGLGRLGYTLGRDKPWTQGRVALYSHYGILMPLEGVALVTAFKSEDPRLYGASILAFGASGYLIADRVADWNDFTKGDIISTQALTTMNALLGLGIVIDKNSDSEDMNGSDLLFPAIGALGGTIAGHFWLKDTRLTKQQGRNTALASAGGATIGLGIAALIAPDENWSYYTIPYITGMTAYTILVEKYRKTNNLSVFNDNKTSRWNVSLTPYTILLNKKIAAYTLANPSKRTYMLPAFSATLNF